MQQFLLPVTLLNKKPLIIHDHNNRQQYETLTVNRFGYGYGTMRLTGEGIYGEPPIRPEALRILQKAVSEGIQFFNTADYYGEDITTRLIAEVFYPYPEDMVICTKIDGARKPDKSCMAFNSPDNIRQSIENNLCLLKIARVQLRSLHGHGASFENSPEAMFKL